MAGTNSRSYRYYRCVAHCGRPHVRAGPLDARVMDLIRRTLITPKAIREIDEVAAEIRQAVAERDELEQVRTPMSTSKKFVQQTMDEMTGLAENAALDTRVA